MKNWYLYLMSLIVITLTLPTFGAEIVNVFDVTSDSASVWNVCLPEPTKMRVQRPNERQPSTISQKELEVNYPLRESWWSVEGEWRPTKSELLSHLRKSPNHSGKKFQKWNLESLSWEELMSLHSDDHEGQVKELLMTKKSTPKVKACEAPVKAVKKPQYCPT